MSVLADSQPRPAALEITGLRRIHLGMIDAVLAGGGVARVAALAAEELDGTVAIILPGEDIASAAPELPDRRLAVLVRYVADRLDGRPAQVPPGLAAEVPVRSGDEVLGAVVLVAAGQGDDAPEILELAALAALTAVTIRDARVTQRRASAALFDELDDLPGTDILARARRLGADLRLGAGALSVRPPTGHTDRVLAAIAQELPGALVAVRGDLVEALAPDGTQDALGRVARRLAANMPVGIAPHEPDAAAFGSALRFAALARELDGAPPEDLLSGSWRLLLTIGATNAAALTNVVDSTVGPATEHLDTLRAYFDHGANMNATATAVYAHRHTVGNRLERVRVLTGHDPQTPRGQAELALGLQALDVQRAATPAGAPPCISATMSATGLVLGDEPLGRLEEWARQRGITLVGSAREPAFIVALADVVAPLRAADAVGVPILGLGAGAVGLASALGARAFALAEPEVGWIDVESADPDRVPSGPWPTWRAVGFELPPLAYELASNARGVQVFCHRGHLGVAFHAEAAGAHAADRLFDGFAARAGLAGTLH